MKRLVKIECEIEEKFKQQAKNAITNSTLAKWFIQLLPTLVNFYNTA